MGDIGPPGGIDAAAWGEIGDINIGTEVPKHIFRRWRRERLEAACKNVKGRIQMLHNQLNDQ